MFHELLAPGDLAQDIHAWESEGGALPPEPDPPQLDDVIELVEFRGRHAADDVEWVDAA